jgi:hypothetical protein
MIYEPKSAAKTVKQRARVAVQYNEDANEVTQVVRQPAAKKIKAKPAAAKKNVK